MIYVPSWTFVLKIQARCKKCLSQHFLRLSSAVVKSTLFLFVHFRCSKDDNIKSLFLVIWEREREREKRDEKRYKRWSQGEVWKEPFVRTHVAMCAFDVAKVSITCSVKKLHFIPLSKPESTTFTLLRVSSSFRFANAFFSNF